MAITPLTVTIDLNPSYKKIPAVYVSQLDNNLRELAITLQDGGVNYNVASSGYDVYIEGTKPDMHGFSYDVTDIGGTVAGSVITVPMQTQMTCVKGMVSTEIVLKSGSDRIGSANFFLVVERAGLDEDTDVSETDIPAYIDGAQRAAEAAEQAKDDAVEAKNTAVAVAASIPEDYTTLSNDVDDLKSAIDTGTQLIDADWARGTINTSGYSPSNYRRVATKTPVHLEQDTVLQADDGYVFSLNLGNSSTNVAYWVTSTIIPTTSDNYMIEVRTEPQASSDITDITPYVKALKKTDGVQLQLNDLERNKADTYLYSNLIDKDHLYAKSLVAHGTGVVVGSSNNVTDYIPVTAGDKLICTNIEAYYSCLYDTDKNYVSDITLTNGIYIVPSNGYVRFTINNTKLATAVVCRWENSASNLNVEKSAIDLSARYALEAKTLDYKLKCGAYNAQGVFNPYVSPSTRLSVVPMIYISEGKLTLSVNSPYQWSATSYRNGAVVVSSPWTSGTGSVYFNKVDYTVVSIRKYVNNAEQTMTEYEDVGLTITVNDGIKTFPDFGTILKSTDEISKHEREYSALSLGLGNSINVMSHLFIDKIYDASNPVIPCESIYDIETIARLGLHFSEGNIHKTSDGYYVVTHGNQGKLGGAFETVNSGSASDVVIAEQTLSDLKTNYRYRSTYNKYKGTILTMEEWLYACVKNNIIPCVQPSTITVTQEFVDKVKSITGNRVVINMLGNDNLRDMFDGVIINYKNTTNINIINNDLATIGAPMIYMLDVTAFDQMTTDQLKAVTNLVHSYGCFAMIPAFYLSVAKRIEAMRCGFDLIGSGWDVEDFHDGNVSHLIGDTSFSDFTHNGTVTNYTLVLSTGKTVSSNNTDTVHIGKGSLHIRFNGTITVAMGEYINTNITSDGTEDVWLSTVFIDEAPNFSISAVNATTIYSITYDASRC